MDPDFAFASRRSPVMGCRGMVAASQPLAASAGLEMLNRGGTAADAAVAAAAMLGLTEPASTGLGGDCFVLYYQASTGKVTALNGSGRSPAAFTLERLQWEAFKDRLPPYHPYTVTVPGACAAWADLVERFGRLNLEENFAPAVRAAEEGFPVEPVSSAMWQAGLHKLIQASGGVELSLRGRAPRPGEIFHNPGLARTLRAVAAGGKAAFYTGEIAAAIARAVRGAGGLLTAEDLAAHASTWEKPISTPYRGAHIWECPPNGQGLVALLALGILEGFDIASLAPLSPERLHLEIEALRLAFADARQVVADPLFEPAPLARLLALEYAAGRRQEIDPSRANLSARPGALPGGRDTVYLCTLDADGNACSMINSIYYGFGTGIVPVGWGFSLQNRGAGFSLEEGHPNAAAPGKRPYHTIIPGMATHPDDGSFLAAFGVMGGYMQPQGHIQVLTALLDDGLDPQAALDRPRFCLEEGLPGGEVALEEGIPPQTVQALATLGHTIHLVSGHQRSIFGRGQVIQHMKNGGYIAGSDPRGDGQVLAQI